jgi:hypothetical protein
VTERGKRLTAAGTGLLRLGRIDLFDHSRQVAQYPDGASPFTRCRTRIAALGVVGGCRRWNLDHETAIDKQTQLIDVEVLTLGPELPLEQSV